MGSRSKFGRQASGPMSDSCAIPPGKQNEEEEEDKFLEAEKRNKADVLAKLFQDSAKLSPLHAAVRNLTE